MVREVIACTTRRVAVNPSYAGSRFTNLRDMV
jgi:hypothetical protein